MHPDDLFQLKCMSKRCVQVANFVCPKCNFFLYCSQDCRTKNHRLRSCHKDTLVNSVQPQKVIEKILKETKDLDRVGVEQVTTEILLKVDKRAKSAAQFSSILLEILKLDHPYHAEQIRAVALFPFRTFRSTWDIEIWKSYVGQYFLAFHHFADVQDFRFVLKFSEAIKNLYKSKKKADDVLQIVSYVTIEVINIFTWVGEPCPHDITAFVGFCDTKNEKEYQLTYSRARNDFYSSQKPLTTALSEFINACIPLVSVKDMDSALHCNVCIDVALSYAFLGHHEHAMTAIQVCMRDTLSRFDSRRVLCIFAKLAIVMSPEDVEEVTRPILDDEKISSLLNIKGHILYSLGQVTKGFDQAVENFTEAFLCFREEKRWHLALDCLFELFYLYGPTDDHENTKKVGDWLFETLLEFPFDRVTGFYRFVDFEEVVRKLMDIAFEEKRFSELWSLAAGLLYAKRISKSWECEELFDIRNFVYFDMLTENQQLFDNQNSRIIESWAKNHQIEIPYGARKQTFGDFERSHKNFVDMTCMVDEDDEKSCAFVWVATERFVYDFVVQTKGVVSVHRNKKTYTKRADGLSRMVKVAKSIPGCVTELVLVDAPERNLDQNESLRDFSVWNA